MKTRYAAVVPLYNRDALIGETLNSLLHQSRPFDQIVVIDDGSTDGGADRVAREFPQVTLIRSLNNGVQVARNTAVAATDADWVVFCDCDDLLEPTYLERLDALLVSAPDLDATFTNFRTFGSESSSSADKFSQAPAGFFKGFPTLAGGVWLQYPLSLERLIDFQPLFPTGMAVRKTFYDTIGGFDPALRGLSSEDLEFTHRMLMLGKVAALFEPLSRVRKHVGNYSGDFVKTLLAEAFILDLSVTHEKFPASLRNRYRASRNERVWTALDYAIGEGRWDAAGEAADQAAGWPPTLKILVKYLMVRARQLTSGSNLTVLLPARRQ
jgi:glycosyltransferase involved in cell wall biosynthesis